MDHAVTVRIGNVRLQASKQGPVVMFEVKVLQPKFGVFDGDLMGTRKILTGKQVSQGMDTLIHVLITYSYNQSFS